MAASLPMLGAVAAHADDARCAVPPYGASVHSFQAFAKNFGHLVTPSKFLPSICQIKYGGADRTSMYNLGFTDQDIDGKPLEDLWVEVLTELHRLARQTK
ncbi:hypothetical protein IVB27_04810 [Bradyrhizobium sp. 197]|uniref:hypothetical protein n=1 Tax=Bradyrhizobium sp. 197 TaxID=2782663 RepID=UPI001FF8CF7E|nr:hypothetical protein [Bradyrhizobium sp. 197]MCK1474149.1 hypothetical protein [Bradyrhizobium sp. 197]